MQMILDITVCSTSAHDQDNPLTPLAYGENYLEPAETDVAIYI